MGCLTGGTHGSLKAFKFSVPKSILQNKVEEVINQNPKIAIAPITGTFTSQYYNDGIRYVSINIADSEDSLEYVFQYSGTDVDWDTSKTSTISIAYAFDQAGNGGSEGSNNFKWYNSKAKQRLVSVFEKELVSPLRQKLSNSNMKK
jgi:hypothetical protein